MARIRGIVLETRRGSITLLTDSGEYVRVADQGRNYSIGAEVVIDVQHRPRVPLLAAAACLLLALLLLVGPAAGPQPVAYLVIDLNPSLFVSLTTDGTVIDARGLNADGSKIVDDTSLIGLSAHQAIDAVLAAAYHALYLTPDRNHFVLVCLAAPPGYVISAADLQAAAVDVVQQLGVDAFVAVPEARPEQAVAAMSRGESINAAAIRQRLVDRGALQRDPDPGPPPPVRDLLNQVPPVDLFDEGEQVRGRPETPPGQGPDKDHTPPYGPPVEPPQRGRP